MFKKLKLRRFFRKALILVSITFSISIFFQAPGIWAGEDAMTKAKRALCEKGNPTACFQMGEYYRFEWSRYGKTQDQKTALNFYIKACDDGYMTGCTNGGILLVMKGTPYSKEFKQARKMFIKACEAGEDPSCFNMGSLYFKEGRQKRSLQYYLKACDMGNKGGCDKYKRLSPADSGSFSANPFASYNDRNLFVPEAEERKNEANRLAHERRLLEEERRKLEQLRLAEEKKPQPPEQQTPQSGTGSGFFVSKMGHVITNAHVVKDCNTVTVGDNANKQVAAEIINTDRSNDLALLKLSSLEMASAESKSLIQKLSIVVVPLASKGLLRSEDVRLGEKVLVAGFPFGDVFSSTIKVTTGVVSSIRGAGDNSGQFQLDAAVQPGNSGGPIYDSSGNIVGVVISQVNKKIFGSLVENVNFGIKASTVRQFLVSSGLSSKKAERTEEKSTEQLAEIAQNQALMVMCLQ